MHIEHLTLDDEIPGKIMIDKIVECDTISNLFLYSTFLNIPRKEKNYVLQLLYKKKIKSVYIYQNCEVTNISTYLHFVICNPFIENFHFNFKDQDEHWFKSLAIILHKVKKFDMKNSEGEMCGFFKRKIRKSEEYGCIFANELENSIISSETLLTLVLDDCIIHRKGMENLILRSNLKILDMSRIHNLFGYNIKEILAASSRSIRVEQIIFSENAKYYWSEEIIAIQENLKYCKRQRQIKVEMMMIWKRKPVHPISRLPRPIIKYILTLM